MLRTISTIGAIVLVFALAACEQRGMEEDVAGQPGIVDETDSMESSDNSQVSDESAAVQPKGTVEYFEEEIGDRVFFAFDSHELTEEARLVLAQQATWLSLFETAGIIIEGHCDERGTREYNIALGARRAASVKNYLVAAGVSVDRLSTVSYGKERPVALCPAEACWSQNRRAVSSLSGVPGS